MGPFQGVEITTTKVHMGSKDLVTISMGSMQPENISGPNALLGVPAGNDQKAIRGNYTELVDGLRDTSISKTDKLHVVLTRTTDLDLDHKLTVTGTETTEIHTDRKLHVFGHDIEDYAVHREVTEPFQYEYKGFDGALKVISMDTIGLDLAFKTTQVEAVGVATGGALIELEQEAIHHRVEAMRSHVAGFVDGFCGFAVKVETEVNASATMSSDHLG
ncbi:hypothetical protein [Granulicella mallensis]|uniref:Uncharacterized protein n=1 Tax=Granulicella mallensis TaxID=940614 RepID=A0A7W7ZNI1_9BACT|nr:hypothetical protein [Granulicella mallensis]MBB5063235.1 hypothetical protein [Granulicella mallensis]